MKFMSKRLTLFIIMDVHNKEHHIELTWTISILCTNFVYKIEIVHVISILYTKFEFLELFTNWSRANDVIAECCKCKLPSLGHIARFTNNRWTRVVAQWCPRNWKSHLEGLRNDGEMI